MTKSLVTRTAAATLALACVLAFSACSKKGDEPASPLHYIPADTPYVFANAEPLPSAISDEWMKSLEPVTGMYEHMLAQAATDLEAEEPGSLPARVLSALSQELKGKLNRAGIEGLGLSTQARSAIYGVGLVPVMRLELKDSAAFEGFVARIEQKVGEKLPRASIDGKEYWRVLVPDAPLVIAAALLDGDLVLTVTHATASEDLLRRLLGLSLPERSLAHEDALAKLNSQWGFSPYGSGYIDTLRVLDAVFDQNSGIEKEFLTALELKHAPPTSAECRTEFRAIAARMPRFVAGYTQFDRGAQKMRAVLELEPTLAQALGKIAAPVPGLGAPTSGAMSFGFGLDLDQLSRFIGAQAAAVAAAPYRCEALLPLNQAFADVQQQLANPMLFAVAAMFKGVNLELSGFSFPAGGMPEISGRLAIASDNPASLIAMAKGNVPQLAGLELEVGKEPIPLPAELAPPGTPPLHLAASDKALGIALGAGAESGLKAFIEAPAGSGPAPLLAMGVTGKMYGEFARMARSSPELSQAMAEASAEDEEGSAGAERAQLEAALAMFEQFERLIKRVDSVVLISDKGIEVHGVTENN